MSPTSQEVDQLREARQKAQKLLEGLLLEQADLEKDPPAIAPDKIAAGRFAMQKAVESARHLLQQLDEVLEV